MSDLGEGEGEVTGWRREYPTAMMTMTHESRRLPQSGKSNENNDDIYIQKAVLAYSRVQAKNKGHAFLCPLPSIKLPFE